MRAAAGDPGGDRLAQLGLGVDRALVRIALASRAIARATAAALAPRAQGDVVVVHQALGEKRGEIGVVGGRDAQAVASVELERRDLTRNQPLPIARGRRDRLLEDGERLAAPLRDELDRRVQRAVEQREQITGCRPAVEPQLQALGLLAAYAVLSDGRVIENPRFLRRAERRLRKAQKAFSRKEQGSKNREKARLKLARAHARVADARRDFHHQLSTKLIRENQAVYVEDLAVKGLARTRLAKSVHDAAVAAGGEAGTHRGAA